MAKKVIRIEPVSKEDFISKIPAKKVCAYCRVSTDSKEQKNSFLAQTKYYEDYIKKQEGWTFAGIYADEAKSGTKLESRDDFQRMMEDCKSGKIDIILTKSVARFARNTIDSISAIRQLKELNIMVFFEEQQINTLSEKSELLLTILSAVAQIESENISANSRWSVIRRFETGTFIIGTPAYGYTKNEYGELIPEQEKAEIVKGIFHDYLNGLGVQAIADTLNDRKILPCKSEKWTDGTILGILRNEVYAGNLRQQKVCTTETLPFKRYRNHGQMPQYFIEDNHEALITKEQFEAVQELLVYRRKQNGWIQKGENYNRYEFSGMIQCGECGGKFRRQKLYVGKSYERVQWCCIEHIMDKDKCSMKAVQEKEIQNAFIKLWNKLYENYEKILLPLLEGLKALQNRQKSQEQLKQYSKSIEELTRQSHILSQSMAEGYIDTALFIRQKNTIASELSEIRKRQKNLLKEDAYTKEIVQTEKIIHLLKTSPEILDEYQKELFEQIVEKIIIDEEQIVFCLKNGLELAERK